MIIKIDRVVSCSSEHPSYPASNLLQYSSNKSWRCAKPGELLAYVIFQLAEPCCITGLDIGNYRSCIVIVEASTVSDPDNWVPIVNHRFMTHDDAANSRFKDQVQLFTKKELNPDITNKKFDRIKATCMQSANLRELFGLTFILFRTEVKADVGLDVFGRFKLKDSKEPDGKTNIDEFKEKYLKLFGDKRSSYKEELRTKVKETGMNTFYKRQEEDREPTKRPLLEKLEAGKKNEVFGERNESLDASKDIVSAGPSKRLDRTPFGDVVTPTAKENKKNSNEKNGERASSSKKRASSPPNQLSENCETRKKPRRPSCPEDSEDRLCETCDQLPPQKPVKKLPENRTAKKPDVPTRRRKEFGKLFEDVSFALSGYVNPQRDEIRRKALDMGGKYIANPDTRNNKCTHLICAFKNTPKSQQLKDHAKIVTHRWIEECHDKKTRFPWRRYALNSSDKAKSESEEEIEGSASSARSPNPYEQDTDSDENQLS